VLESPGCLPFAASSSRRALVASPHPTCSYPAAASRLTVKLFPPSAKGARAPRERYVDAAHPYSWIAACVEDKLLDGLNFNIGIHE
jgi:hypothetical protein